MSIGANETEIKYWTDYANPRDGICFRKEDAHTLVHEHYELERIKVENAKLRELLTFYIGCLTKGHVNCDSCALKDDVCDHGRKVIDGAREIGIEVN